MALSDCEKCWDTPCVCGHYWRNYSEEAKRKQCEAIMGEKMYSRKELEEKCRLAFIAGFSVPSTKIGVDEWIKETLL